MKLNRVFLAGLLSAALSFAVLPGAVEAKGAVSFGSFKSPATVTTGATKPAPGGTAVSFGSFKSTGTSSTSTSTAKTPVVAKSTAMTSALTAGANKQAATAAYDARNGGSATGTVGSSTNYYPSGGRLTDRAPGTPTTADPYAEERLRRLEDQARYNSHVDGVALGMAMANSGRNTVVVTPAYGSFEGYGSPSYGGYRSPVASSGAGFGLFLFIAFIVIGAVLVYFVLHQPTTRRKPLELPRYRL